MRTDTTAGDLMHREFLGVSESDTVTDVASLLVEETTDALIVVRGGTPVGSLSCRDVLATVLSDDADAAVGDVMDPAPPTVEPSDSLAAIEELLVAEGANSVVVTADGEAVGVVTDHDALAAGTARTQHDPSGTLEAGTGTDHAAPSDPTSATPDMAPDPSNDPAVAREVDRAMTADVTDASGSPTQGVCEVCGTLTPSLSDSNGQIVCPDCQQV